MVIHQGDIFWVDVNVPFGSEPGYRHPYVVVQNNVFNSSGIATTIVCLLTSNVRRSGSGNVLLNVGEAGLPRRSVVNVSQVYTLDKNRLLEHERIGTLSPQRVREILDGIHLVLEPMEV